MIYTSLKSIQDHIIDRERPFWRMYQRDEKNLIAETVDIEGITPNKSSDILAKEIQNLDGTGYVIVRLYANPPGKGGNNTGSLTFYVKIGNDEENIKGYPGSNINFGMFQQFNQELTGLKLAMIEKDKNREIEDLKRQYEEKNKQVNLDPTLKEIISLAKLAIFNKKGSDTNTAIKTTPATVQHNSNAEAQRGINGIEDKQEFIKLLKRWNELDSNYLEVMKSIVYFAETDADTYKFQTGLLIDQFKNKKK